MKEGYVLLFEKEFSKREDFNIGDVMRRLRLSRPTAKRLIDHLAGKKKVDTVFLAHDSRKWYRRLK